MVLETLRVLSTKYVLAFSPFMKISVLFVSAVVANFNSIEIQQFVNSE